MFDDSIFIFSNTSVNYFASSKKNRENESRRVLEMLDTGPLLALYSEGGRETL
jgi:hypothetical protein